MNFDTIKGIGEYVRAHSVEELLVLPLNNQDPIYSCNISAVNDISKKIDILNEATKGKYTIILGDTINAEVTDIKNSINRYEDLYNTLFDDISRNTRLNLLAYRLTREERYILSAYSGSRQYFDSEIVKISPNCVYADCGSLDGYTTAEFILNCPSYKKIYMYEPMEEQYRNCCDNIRKLKADNIILRQYAVYDKKTTLSFSSNISGSSKVDNNGDITINAISLDEDIAEPLGFIKMDIEGSEKAAIKGAERHIRNDTPTLAICVYHLPADLWEIPDIIKSINPEYHFILRHHEMNTDETVLYAIPDKTVQPEDNPEGFSISSDVEIECLKFENSIIRAKLSDIYATNKYLLEQNSDIKKWNYQLMEAKEYFLTQIHSLEQVIKAQEAEIIETDKIINENKKLRFYLKEEINKPWYKKLLKKGSINNYINQIKNSED